MYKVKYGDKSPVEVQLYLGAPGLLGLGKSEPPAWIAETLVMQF